MSKAVAEYGQLIGREELLAVLPGQACRLEWGDGSALELVEHDRELLVSLCFPAPHLRSPDLLQALQFSDLRQDENAHPLQVGLTGSGLEAHLVVLARLPSTGADGRLIQQATERLQKWRRRWEVACKRDAAEATGA